MAFATESGNSLAMMAKEAVTNPALPLAWMIRMTKDRTINVVASSILSKNLKQNRQAMFTYSKTCSPRFYTREKHDLPENNGGDGHDEYSNSGHPLRAYFGQLKVYTIAN